MGKTKKVAIIDIGSNTVRLVIYQVSPVGNISQLQKITRPDTLNFDNAIGNVWYNKSDGKVEFFTNYGLHPENGKTLKPISKYILNKYALKND